MHVCVRCVFELCSDVFPTSISLSGCRSWSHRMILWSLPPPVSRVPFLIWHSVNTLPSWALIWRVIWNAPVGEREGVRQMETNLHTISGNRIPQMSLLANVVYMSDCFAIEDVIGLLGVCACTCAKDELCDIFASEARGLCACHDAFWEFL